MEEPSPSANCQKCGAPSQHLISSGTVFSFTELDVEPLAALFNKTLDTLWCATTGCPPLPAFPTVVVKFSSPPVSYVVIGSRMQGSRVEFLTGLTSTYDEQNLTIEECTSFDSLRNGVGKRLARKFEVINPILIAGSSDELNKYVLATWRTLTPECLAAAQVAFSAPIPSVRILAAKTSEDDPSLSQLRHKLARAQAVVWLAMAMTWPEGGDDEPSFEDSLQRFINRGVILPEAPEIFSIGLSSQDGERSISPLAEYCVQACWASICAATSNPNARANKWAEIFFAHELACREGGDKVLDKVRAMTIADERAKSTIEFRSAWDAVARRLSGAPSPERLKSLADIAAKAGHPHLVSSIITEGRVVRGMNNVPIDLLIDALRSAVASAGGGEGVIEVSKPFAQQLLVDGRIDDLERLGDAMIDMLRGGYDARARVEAWLGSWLKLSRMPKRFLNRIGETPRNWEYSLEPYTRVLLWTERANAFRLLGRFDDAHPIYEEIYLGLIDQMTPEDRHVAQRNYAISLREIGAPDGALDLLIPLLEEVPSEDPDRIHLLHTTAVTYHVLGQHRKALPFLDEAISLAVGPRVRLVPLLRMTRAHMFAASGRYEEAIEDIQTVKVEKVKDALVLATELSSWAILLANDALPPWAAERLRNLMSAMSALIEDAAARNDARAHLETLHLLAWLHENLDEREAALDFWQTAINTAVEIYNRPPDVVALVSVARFAYESGQSDIGRAHLRLVPTADASHIGGVTDLALAVDGTKRVHHALNRVSQVIMESARQVVDWQDVRLVAELRRDVVGRAQAIRRRGHLPQSSALLADGLSDVVVGRLAIPTGTLAVVEWIDDGEVIGGFVTLISPTGEVESHWLTAPEFKPNNLAKKIRKRLRDWRPSRSGDPFDLPEWVSLESWIIEELSRYLTEGDHVVLIEHGDYAGIPWHVALSRHWTCSYASGWTSLLSLFDLPRSASIQNSGVLMASRFNESLEILTALRESVARTRRFAAAHKLGLLVAEQTSCDREAIARVMAESEVAKFLCHGFIDSMDGEVALMIAHGGSLPLAHSVASASEIGREHRLSWKDFQSFTVAPQVVFSAACSTGVSHVAGLGERLGFFGALRHIGTRAVVAPQWNIVAGSVIPLLDEVMENYVSQRGNLAEALRSVCIAAEKNKCPRWQVWALALEGDWR